MTHQTAKVRFAGSIQPQRCSEATMTAFAFRPKDPPRLRHASHMGTTCTPAIVACMARTPDTGASVQPATEHVAGQERDVCLIQCCFIDPHAHVTPCASSTNQPRVGKLMLLSVSRSMANFSGRTCEAWQCPCQKNYQAPAVETIP
jgi:hypothetical protein